MNEKNNGKNMSTIKGLMILVGILAVVASYFFVFSKYKTKNEDIKTKIEELDVRLEELEKMDRNKEVILKNTEEINAETEKVLAKLDGGLSYQAEIVDLQDFIYDEEVSVPSLTISAPTDTYTFSDGNVGKSITYSYTSTGTYAQMKEAIKYFDEYEGKRKVPTSISFVYDYASQKVSLAFNVIEYAVAGEGREQKEVIIPEYKKGRLNVFYDETIS